jgi:hypothetical protein
MLRISVVVFFSAVIATAAVGLPAKLWYDQAALARHGANTTATIGDINCGRYGCTALVAFTLPDGDTVNAYLHDPPDGRELVPGDTVQVRYDPTDPALRLVPVGEDRTVLYLVCAGIGVLMWVAIVIGVRRIRSRRVSPPVTTGS